ncbi:hypothetical protein [Roseibium sp.]|uniref:hypothetical protein n=1 Tax=Roseibium sp. TaxID=1936156 RepID=UPI001B1EC0DE|nr:hypothetical protein [Roseibium sp.]MBO6858334.1 hypothetical protein [Roseibium sp.]
MSIRPILFSGPMVRALLEGRKTQTRRVLKPQPKMLNGGKPLNNGRGAYSTENGWKRYPYAKDDLLYVRETFTLTQHQTPVYRADATDQTGQRWHTIQPGDPEKEVMWKPGIHMPRWASRLTLKVTDVMVQRLQDITWEDAEAEGVWFSSQEYREQVCIWRDAPSKLQSLRVEYFGKLWDSLNEKRGFGWGVNPWVVAVTFEVHRCNVDSFDKEKAA